MAEIETYRFHIKSKWEKTLSLLNNPVLRPFIPATCRLGAENLRKMTERHRIVFAKPDLGAKGKGIIRIERLSEWETEFWRLQREKESFEPESWRDLVLKLADWMGRVPYLLQQGVELLTVSGRPFDIRLMVQRAGESWVPTGMVGRLAAPGMVVTNRSRGGLAVPVEELLAAFLQAGRRETLMEMINQLGVTAGEHLQTVYPEIREIGLDVGVDRRFRLWILEYNTLPVLRPFAQLKDRTMLNRIIRYGESYGRRYKW